MESTGFYTFDIRRYFDLSPSNYIQYERENIRRCILYFDKLIINPVAYESACSYLEQVGVGRNELILLRSEIEYFLRVGLIEMQHITNFDDNDNLWQAICTLSEKRKVNEVEFNRSDTENREKIRLFIEAQQMHGLMDELVTRYTAIQLERKFKMTVCPITYPLKDPFAQALNEYQIKNDYINLIKDKYPVVSVVLHKIPNPSIDISPNKVNDFKRDEEARLHLLALRNYVTDISKENLSYSEINDRFEYKIHEYKKHLSLHKIKYDLTAFEVFLIATSEILENVVKLQFSKAIREIISLKKREIEIYEGGLMLPGKEVAYLTKVEEKM